jgi:arsenate reductase (glutaredoxin)
MARWSWTNPRKASCIVGSCKEKILRITELCRGFGENITFAGRHKTANTMKKIYHLSTCDTCRRILKDIDAGKKGFTLQDIKTEQITPAQLDELKEKAGSYEALFSRRAIKYKEMKLKDKKLTEKDYRKLILQDYTFLKRPVVIDGNSVCVGGTPLGGSHP